MPAFDGEFWARVLDGVVMGLAVLAMVGGGFAMGRIDGVQLTEDQDPQDDSMGDGGG